MVEVNSGNLAQFLFYFRNRHQRILFGILTLILSNSAFAQVLSGNVQDKIDGSPLEGVNIYNKTKKIGAVTDENGNFSFLLNEKTSINDTIYFSYIGYNIVKKSVADLKLHPMVILERKTENLENVDLKGERITRRESLNFKRLTNSRKRLNAFGSVLVGNKIYVFGGDESENVNGFQRALDINPSLGDFSYTGDPQGFQRFITTARSLYRNYNSYNNKVYVYEIEEDDWSVLDFKIKPRAYLNACYSKELNKIFLIGGTTMSVGGTQYLYQGIESLELKTRQSVAEMKNPHESVNATVIPIDGGLVVMGGSISMDENGLKSYSDAIDLFLYKKKKWFKIGSMTEGKEAPGVLIGSKIFLFGGDSNGQLSKIESYDLNSGKWNLEGDLFEPMDELSVTTDDRKAYIYVKGRIIIYDSLTKTLREFSINIDSRNPAIHFYNGRLFILGGYKDVMGGRILLSDSYSIEIDEFNKTNVQRYRSF